MAIFLTEEWLRTFEEKLNTDPQYADIAKNWEGDVVMTVNPGENLEQQVVMYFDLWHGKCREATVITDENEKSPKYRIFGPFTNMKQILDKKVDPVQSMMTGKIKVKGDMAQIMKMPRAAVELVNCMTAFETVFPD